MGVKNLKTESTPANAGVAYVTDAGGRRIGVKRPGVVQHTRLTRALGAENDRFFGLAILAASVVEMDGEPVSPPVSALQVEHILQRLDEAGLEAIAAHFTAVAEEAERTKAGALAEAKN